LLAVFTLRSKVAVVTGGASGIGLAVATRLHAAGAVVVVADIDESPEARARVAAIGDVPLVRCDVSDEPAVGALLDSVVAEHGRLDVLVSNAGIGLPAAGVGDESTARMLRLFRVNTLGVLHGLRHAARVMTDGGAVVNVGSLAGGVGWAETASYSVSKAGVEALTRTAAVELAASGIRVNAVAPSMIDTPMVAQDTPHLNAERAFVTASSPAARLGRADEIAAAVHFLASDDCGYLTGQVLVVDGGLTAGPSPALLERLRDD
jgi:NAD(P)-dependent dehydrogenase (short-subunit alcohol dehydrogenase family)